MPPRHRLMHPVATPFFCTLRPLHCLSPPPHRPSLPPHCHLLTTHVLLTIFSRSLAPLGCLSAIRRHSLMPPHCLLSPLCCLLAPPLHWSVKVFCRSLTPLRHPLMSSSCLIISLWWCLAITTLLELDYQVKVTPRQIIICASICSIPC